MARNDKPVTKVTDGSNTDPEANLSTAARDRRARMEAEQARESGEASDDEGRTYAVEGNELDGYVGVSPEYKTYANETERPYRAEEGTPERWEEDKLLGVAGKQVAEEKKGEEPLVTEQF